MGKVAWKKASLFQLGGCIGCSKSCLWNGLVTFNCDNRASKYNCN